MSSSLDPTLVHILNIGTTPSQNELDLMKKTQRYARLVSWIPGLRMIAVCNSVSMYASEKDSDIDLFVVTDPGRIWLVRGLLTLALQLFGVRRYGHLVKGRFCLSFFATTEALNMGKIALPEDPYLEAWTYHLIPILDRGYTYKEFIGANTVWRKIVPGYHPEAQRYVTHLSREDEYFAWVWNFLDGIFHTLFLPRTQREYERLGKPWGIVISDTMLKFHRDDRREEILQQWKSKS